MSRITVWGWGDKYEAARANSESCVEKFWREATKECHIALVGKDRREGIIFGIDVYADVPKSVGFLVERLLSLALTGKNKVYEITMEFLMEEPSHEEHLKTLEEIEKEYEILTGMCIEKVKNDPRVKPLTDGRKILVFPDMNLFVELEPEYGLRMTLGAFHFNFNEMLKFIQFLSENLIKNKLAKRILGYGLSLDIDRLEVSDVDVTEDEVLVDLVASESKNLRSENY
ncbi:MAG: hypothetical protein FGF50_08570 [Candidatus Brockarchaeota archaeon]|nr:hypothetical protein [Candidatus Brockarchaeota archaeon]